MSKQQKTTATPSVTGDSTVDEIRDLAYQLYCEGGYQNGRDLEYWLQAERQVLAGRKAHLQRAA